MTDLKLMKLAADTVRLLSADGIQKANSGHPGMPMGCADFAVALWQNYMCHNPKNPHWIGRDRFVLSAGHGSMLLYSLLHLYNYGLPMEQLKSFRQWGSLTPGHPEFGHTTGVEVTTGPLGSGLASAVGLACAAKQFAAMTGLDKAGFRENKVYVIAGDGCMMEGTTHEASSFAGHQKLDNLICFYDSNNISIEGNTNLAFTENVAMRYEAYGWRVIKCENANDTAQVDAALKAVQVSDGRPTLIIGHTVIGFGSPTKAGKHSAHGEPLGADELTATKKAFGFPETPFYVPEEVYAMAVTRADELEKEAAAWDAEFQKFLEANPEKAKLASQLINKEVPANILEELLKVTPVDKPIATRASSGTVLQKVSELVPSLTGGSADLAPSTKTDVKNTGWFSPEDRTGRNFHFGVRELGMALFANGMALYGTTISYSSTFMVFSDYMKPAIRLAALQKLPEIYVFTHDSFYVGEDGPTHEPVEQLTMLRTIPDMTLIRPADANEVAHAWAYAVNAGTPVALALTRQDLRPLSAEMAKKIDMEKGAYIISEDSGFDMILIATGSEVNLAIDSAEALRAEGKKIRVVSMPSCELFLKQDKAYRDSVLPPSCTKKVSIEAGSTACWKRFTGDGGLEIGLDHFGASAPYKVLAEKFGFTTETVVKKIKDFYSI